VIAALRRAGISVPRALPTAVRGQAADHLFLLRLASALAAQNPPVTLAVDDLHLLTEPRLLDGLDSCCATWGLACAWWSPRGRIRCCRCTVTGWPASWPRSARATLLSAPPKPDC